MANRVANTMHANHVAQGQVHSGELELQGKQKNIQIIISVRKIHSFYISQKEDVQTQWDNFWNLWLQKCQKDAHKIGIAKLCRGRNTCMGVVVHIYKY